MRSVGTVLRRRRTRAVEATGDEVPERWRGVLADCERLEAQLSRLLASVPGGPLQRRLGVLHDDVVASVAQAVAAARRAGDVERLASGLDVAGITAEYKRARRQVEEASARGAVPDALAGSVESLRRQHESAHRLLNAVDEAGERLEAVRQRLREVVLTAGELVVGAPQGGLDVAEQQAASLAAEVRALREAFVELS